MFVRDKNSKKRRKNGRRTVKYAILLFTLSATAGLGFFVHQGMADYQKSAHAPVTVPLDPNTGVKAYVESFLKANNAAALLPIIKCESHFKQFDKNGNVLKNKAGSSAVGVAQILSSQHPDQKIIDQYNKRNDTNLSVNDFDLNTVRGNIGYALILYKIRGTQDWQCAK